MLDRFIEDLTRATGIRMTLIEQDEFHGSGHYRLSLNIGNKTLFQLVQDMQFYNDGNYFKNEHELKSVIKQECRKKMYFELLKISMHGLINKDGDVHPDIKTFLEEIKKGNA